MKKLICIVLTLIMLLSMQGVSAATNYCELFEKTLSCFTWVNEYGNESTPFSANTIAFVTSRQLDFTDRYNADKSSEFDECYSFPKAEFEALAQKLFDVKVDLTTANYSELVDVKFDANTQTYDVITHPRGSSLHYGVYGYSQSGGVYSVYLQMVDGEEDAGEYAKAKCTINGEYAKIISFETISSLPDINTLTSWPSSQVVGTVSKETTTSTPSSNISSDTSSNLSSEISSEVSSGASSETTDDFETEILLNTYELSISAPKGMLPEGAMLTVGKIEDAEKITFLNTALEDIAMTYTAYDITAVKNGAKVQPNGTIYATFKIPATYDLNRVAVLYIADDGKTEECVYVVDKTNRTVTAELTHLSCYAVIEGTYEYMDMEKDGGGLVTIIILAVGLLAAGGVFAWYKLYYKKKLNAKK